MTTTAQERIFVGKAYHSQAGDIKDGLYAILTGLLGYGKSETWALLKQCSADGGAYGEPLFFRFPESLRPIIEAQEMLGEIAGPVRMIDNHWVIIAAE